ncbi:MAG: HlyD family efflux transporter periplasmic adaptor subunit [Zoogloeaceae bacterium]|jgi:membrane fusion protein (multidrug efflux system)|nr:HlyD family efflux transporter periplasmic adaptor subunit [Zoogloeaceae bacterium]
MNPAPLQNDASSGGNPASPAPPASAQTPDSGARRRALLMLCGAFLGLAALWGTYWFFVSRWQESTDDAYVAGHVAQITPQVAGTVRAVRVEDTDRVSAGDTLVELDDADNQIALREAEAALARTVREARALYVNNRALRAQVAARQAEVDRLALDLSRREAIVESGAVAQEELDHTREALRAAKANFSQAREQLAANRALTDGSSLAEHPAVLHAAAQFEAAYLALSRTRIVAPTDGQVARRSVQIGQKVAAGAPLMALIDLDRLWVDANFKEVQLDRMRLGQTVTLTADLHGAKARYRGRVAGFAAGTGSAFALLPAQNATGNWIKVVQRVPVRIELEAEDLKAYPLRVGLSMRVTVDLRDQASEAINQESAAAAPFSAASGKALAEARLRVEAIIRAHDVALSR